MPPLADRRAHVRLEVVGALWGTLEVRETTRVVNISTTGVLLKSLVPVARDAMQSVSLVVDGEPMVIDAQVRRLEQTNPDDNSPPQYLIGLEFVSPPLRLVHSIERLYASVDQRT
jgi:hypothetical protein